MHEPMRVARRTWRKWRDEQGTRQAAGLAFYALFTLAPLLVLSTWLTDSVLGDFVLVNSRAIQLGALMPDPLVDVTEELVLTNAAIGSKRAAVLAVCALIYAPVRGFLQLQSALNDVWGVRAVRGPGPMNLIRRKGLAFVSVGTTLCLLFVGVALNGVLLNAGSQVTSQAELSTAMWVVSDWVGSFALIFGLLLVVFKSLPDAVVGWKPVLAGAGLTAFLLIAGREAIAAYLATTTRLAAFGAAGSMVALLLFAYYACQVLLFGAAFTWVVADELGQAIQPGSGAVGITKQQVLPVESAEP